MRNILAILIALFLCFSLFSCGGDKKKEIEKVIISDSLSPEIAKLNAQIKSDPNNANLYNERAKLLLEKQKIDEAFADIRNALNIDSSKAPYFLTLSDVYFANGKIKNCKLAIEKAMLLDSKYAEADLKYAELNLYFKDYKKTNEYIDKALAIDKINPKAYFMRGMAYKEVGDTAKAVSNFKISIDQDAEYYHAYIQLGILYSLKKSLVAVDYFKNALKLNTKSIEARYGLGMFYQENDEYDKAIEEYDSILQIDFKYKFAHYNIGYIYLVYLKDYKKAITNFTNAITYDSDYAEAYYNRGYSYELLMDFQNAKADYKKALEIKTNYQKAIEGLNRIENSK